MASLRQFGFLGGLAVLLWAAGAPASLAQDTILLHSRAFIPAPGLTSANRATLLAQLPTSLTRVYGIVQVNGVPNPAQVAALKALGLTRVAYLPFRGWIASMPRSASAMNALAAHPSVRAIVPLQTDDRISPEIRTDGIDPRLIGADGKALIEVRVADDLALAAVIPLVLPFVTSVDAQSDSLHSLRVRMPPVNVAELAAQGFVLLIDEPPPPGADDNDFTRTNTRAGQVQIVEDVLAAGEVVDTEPGEPFGLDGTGVLIGQWETGRPDTCHPDFKGTLAADSTTSGTQIRVTFGTDDDGVSDADCRDPLYDPDSDADRTEHATHVAGILAGNGSESVNAGWTQVQFRGMAPNAEVVAFIKPLSRGDDNDATAWEVEEHAAQVGTATGQGAVLANFSWSYDHCSSASRAFMTCYDLGAEHYDRLVLDAAHPARDRALIIVGSAGNAGPGFGTTGMPNSGKNTLVVGNIESDTDALSNSSSRGPVDDGRIKPEVVAPGDRSGVDGLGIENKVRSTANTNHAAYPYDRLSGTSMSTPAVAGGAALLVQQFRTRAGMNPWPSTLKALVIHTARDICCTDLGGNDVDTPGPDYAYGFGALDIRAAADLLRDPREGMVVEAPGFAGSGTCATDPALACDYDADGSADDQERLVELPADLASYRVTLVWDDLPQTELLRRGAPALRNDLDLFLVAPSGAVHRAWLLDRDNPASAATRGINVRDNVEVVDVALPEAGPWRIVVRPVAINPSDLADPPQRYSLVYAQPGADVMIRDYPSDDGGVPSARHEHGGWVPRRFWRDSDITIDGDEVIRAGEPRTLHVSVTNTGSTTVDDAVVDLFFAHQGVGLDYDDFTANPVGSCALPALAPGQSSTPGDCTIAHTWNAPDLVVGADGNAHLCLLARVGAAGDDVTFPGRGSIPAGSNPAVDYVPWDNNLAQQNLAIEDAASGDGAYDVDVHNPSDAQARPVQVVIDARELPSGWSAQLAGGPIFTLPAGGAISTRLQITPPAGAVEGASGHVEIHGLDLTSGALLSGVGFTLVDSDRDGDAVRDAEGGVPGPLDNCSDESNSTQADADGDGRGNACECGDLNADGFTSSEDAARLRQALAGIGLPLSSADLRRCSVIGPASTCDVTDASVLRRALVTPPLPPGIAQACAAAGGV